MLCVWVRWKQTRESWGGSKKSGIQQLIAELLNECRREKKVSWIWTKQEFFYSIFDSIDSSKRSMINRTIKQDSCNFSSIWIRSFKKKTTSERFDFVLKKFKFIWIINFYQIVVASVTEDFISDQIEKLWKNLKINQRISLTNDESSQQSIILICMRIL